MKTLPIDKKGYIEGIRSAACSSLIERKLALGLSMNMIDREEEYEKIKLAKIAIDAILLELEGGERNKHLNGTIGRALKRKADDPFNEEIDRIFKYN